MPAVQTAPTTPYMVAEPPSVSRTKNSSATVTALTAAMLPPMDRIRVTSSRSLRSSHGAGVGAELSRAHRGNGRRRPPRRVRSSSPATASARYDAASSEQRGRAPYAPTRKPPRTGPSKHPTALAVWPIADALARLARPTMSGVSADERGLGQREPGRDDGDQARP